MAALTSKEVLEKVSDSAIPKSTMGAGKLLVMGILAGAYIAFGAEASAMASFNLVADPATLGVGKFLGASVFPVGLMMVIIGGAELFTGNCLMVVGVVDKKATIAGMMRNWGIVYIGNLIGSLLMVLLMSQTGLWDTGGGLLGAVVVKTAVGKVSLSFGKAFILGILCNWLVCMAVYIATGAQEVISKIFAIWFIIMLFVLSGFEHSVANMYFIPAGIVAATNETYVQLLNLDVSGLNVGTFLLKNLLPVTLGNIVGGSGFVGMIYLTVHKKLK